QKKASRKIGLIGEIYWGIMVAIYLGVSFVTMRWDLTWIIWPVAGVLFGAVTSIVKLISKAE
ncbi:MAG: XRE family transcriptional regulator, partial [Lachnospiraceae bacterium]